MSEDRSDYPGTPLTDREILLLVRRDVREMRRLMDRDIESLREDIRACEKRVTILERFRWWLAGAIVGSAGLAAFIAKLVR